jgi:hypothetical protein
MKCVLEELAISTSGLPNRLDLNEYVPARRRCRQGIVNPPRSERKFSKDMTWIEYVPAKRLEDWKYNSLTDCALRSILPSLAYCLLSKRPRICSRSSLKLATSTYWILLHWPFPA